MYFYSGSSFPWVFIKRSIYRGSLNGELVRWLTGNRHPEEYCRCRHQRISHHSDLHFYLSTCRDRNKPLRLCPDGNDRTVGNIDVDMYCVVNRIDHHIRRIDRYIIPVFKKPGSCTGINSHSSVGRPKIRKDRGVRQCEPIESPKKIMG